MAGERSDGLADESARDRREEAARPSGRQAGAFTRSVKEMKPAIFGNGKGRVDNEESAAREDCQLARMRNHIAVGAQPDGFEAKSIANDRTIAAYAPVRPLERSCDACCGISAKQARTCVGRLSR